MHSLVADICLWWNTTITHESGHGPQHKEDSSVTLGSSQLLCCALSLCSQQERISDSHCSHDGTLKKG